MSTTQANRLSKNLFVLPRIPISIAILLIFGYFLTKNIQYRHSILGSESQPNITPSIEILDEVTHYVYARDALSVQGYFLRLLVDDWGRPGNILAYVIPSLLSIEARRVAASIMLGVTTIAAVYVGVALKHHGSFITIPALLALQPWFFHYGGQSLTQTPFMMLLTLGIAFWLHKQYRLAALCMGMLPLVRHEALPITLLWLLYFFRGDIGRWWQGLWLEIRRFLKLKRKLVVSPSYTMSLPHEIWRGWVVILTLAPYFLWNLLSAFEENSLPFVELFNFTSRASGEYQVDISAFLAGISEWSGFVFFVLLISTIIPAILWLTSSTPVVTGVILGRKEIQVSSIEAEKFRSRTWWIPFAAFVVINVLILLLEGNPFASGGYDFFLLPVAPAIAISAARLPILAVLIIKRFGKLDEMWEKTLVFLTTIILFILLLVNVSRITLPQGSDLAARQLANRRQAAAIATVEYLVEKKPPLIISNDPFIHYYVSQVNGLDDSLCHAHIWNVDPFIPLYPNLLPTNTVFVLSDEEHLTIPGHVNASGVRGYQTDELIRNLPDEYQLIEIGSNNTTDNRTSFRFDENHTFAVFQKQLASPNNFSPEYKRRYCGEPNQDHGYFIVLEDSVSVDAINPIIGDFEIFADIRLRIPILECEQSSVTGVAPRCIVVVEKRDNTLDERAAVQGMPAGRIGRVRLDNPYIYTPRDLEWNDD